MTSWKIYFSSILQEKGPSATIRLLDEFNSKKNQTTKRLLKKIYKKNVPTMQVTS